MNWPDIANDLPAPRDDEPSSLRQDIADELADHLHSSFAGELHRTPDQTQAQQHVLDRFGDPRRVARQLWFDAMKEKIMSQRVNLVISSLMTAACLGALGLMTVMLRDSREVNAAILERLAALAKPQPAAAAPQPVIDTSKSLDWVQPKFKLVLGEKGGPPAVGHKVQMQAAGGGVLGETEKNGVVYQGLIEEAAGTDGIVDLGLFRFGTYTLTVTTPWGEHTSRQIGLRPGQEPIREIVCPAAQPEQADVAFSVEWPEDLQNMNLRLICNFSAGTRRVGRDTWYLAVPGLIGGVFGVNNQYTEGVLVINSEGKSAIIRALRHQVNVGDESGPLEGYEFVTQPEFIGQQQMPALQQRFSSLKVIRAEKEEGSVDFRVLASMYGGMGMGTGMMGGGMGGMGSGMMGGQGGGFFNVADEQTPKGTPAADSLAFMACDPKAGQVNQWNIRLPEYVLDQIRIKLGLKDDPNAPKPTTSY